MKKLIIALVAICLFSACDDDAGDAGMNVNESTANLKIKFKFDSTQERLDNFGNPSTIPAGNAAQSPVVNAMSAFLIELVPTQTTLPEQGAVIYRAATQDAEPGGDFSTAVIFDQALIANETDVFLEIPIKDLPTGTYEYLRASVTYQNGDVKFNLKNLPPPLPSSLDDQSGTLATFLGFNSHITTHTVKNRTLTVNADKQQGFWMFEPQLDEPYQTAYLSLNTTGIESGQAPAGSTTVVNLLASFGVQIPFGTCIVTGDLDTPLTITGNETEDITITLSFSINQSFEWKDTNGNGEWDMDVSNQTVEEVVDMGLRGLKVFVD